MAEEEKHFPGQAETEKLAEAPAPEGDKAPEGEKPEAEKPEGDKPKPGDEQKPPEGEKKPDELPEASHFLENACVVDT